ncbi:MAG: 2-phospho-L-lactate transferase [SAR202 cluster bacterium]|nr:2-phospho-L-lactate transferase [SAR202 cluster bacterium]
MTTHVLAIAGGVGGAKLALGLTRVLAPDQLTIAVNTGDDETFHGLHVSPDLDTVMYTLAGMSNPETGWGIAGETFRALGALQRLGANTWFRLGDLDLATHIRRTQLLRDGLTLSQATRELTSALGIRHPIVPMSDDVLRTVAVTDDGELAFQEYFVHRHCEPRIAGIRFEGAATARPSPGLWAALASATAIVYCPSNPLVSIGPVLALAGVRDAIAAFAGPKIAVSPIVGGQAVKGPAAKMMAELGEEVSCVGVARRYAGVCDAIFIDTVDAANAGAIEGMGMRAYVTDTVMHTDDDKEALARQIVGIVEAWDE